MSALECGELLRKHPQEFPSTDCDFPFLKIPDFEPFDEDDVLEAKASEAGGLAFSSTHTSSSRWQVADEGCARSCNHALRRATSRGSVKGGCEALVHPTQAVLDKLHADDRYGLFQLDLANAFNFVSR